MSTSEASSVDIKSHYGVIIIGAGFSGLCANIQLKRVLGYTDVMEYTEDADIGGTWFRNTYPGAACDIPIVFYCYSFAQSSDFVSQFASHSHISRYIHWVRNKFQLNNIVCGTRVEEVRWSSSTRLWTVTLKDLATGLQRTRTANIVISAVGALSNPNIPEWVKEGKEQFDGDVFHSAQWDHEVDLKGKKVVLVGNGASAIQIVPAIIDQVGTLTQVARSRQSILPSTPLPDGALFWKILTWIPGFLLLLRSYIFFATEGNFISSDIELGQKKRELTLQRLVDNLHKNAPRKYWDALMPDFDIAAKRRIFSSRYYPVLHNEKYNLIHDDAVVSMKGDEVMTRKGQIIKADVIVLSTGFVVQNFFSTLRVVNDAGETLQDRLNATHGKAFQSTCVSDFPNFFSLMGPNSATGHSSVIFTSECQVNMILKLVKPILKKLKRNASLVPGPSVEVKPEAENAQYKLIRAEMKKKVWEKDGGVSWYVDKDSGLCTVLHPWNQQTFWWNSRNPSEENFIRK